MTTDQIPPASESAIIPRVETTLKILFWLFPLIFAAGTWYATSGHSVSNIKEVEAKTVTLQKRVDDHEVLEAHPVSKTRLNQVQKAVNRIEIEQRALTVEQRRSTENISAICQATNANCR